MSLGYDLYVRAQEEANNTLEVMKEHDELLIRGRIPACFDLSVGNPLQEEDGTWRVIVYKGEGNFDQVKDFLTVRCDLQIVRQNEHTVTF